MNILKVCYTNELFCFCWTERLNSKLLHENRRWYQIQVIVLEKHFRRRKKNICWNVYVTRVTSIAVLLWPVPKIESNEMIGTSERFARKSFNKLNNKPIKMLLGSASVTLSYLKIICIRDYNECWYFGPKQFIDFSQRLRSQV